MQYSQFLAIIVSTVLVCGCQEAPTPAASGEDAPSSTKTAANAQGKAQAPASTAGAGQTTPPVKPVPAKLPNIVARVNDETIGNTDLERAVQNVKASAGQELPAGERDRVYRGVLDELIAFHLLSQEGASRKIAVTDQEVTKHIDRLQQQFPDEKAFTAALKERHLSLDDLEADTRRQMVADKVLRQEVDPKVTVGAQEVDAFYKENPERFRAPERVRASHILIKADATADEASKKAARARAEGLRKQLEGGADFTALAREHSQDGSASSGGDLNYFPRGQMVKPFEDTAFALKVGELSDVVETPFGYHIIKVTDRKASELMPLDDTLKGRIEQVLRMGRRRELAVQLVQALRAKGKVEVFI
ncbi:MAG: hypothetical protein GEU99_01585 [Luteitalea sp.]|nr:hypothetical protein [Luteitalea sp.]